MTGYRVRDGQWTEIGRIDPQKPQVSIKLNESIDKHILCKQLQMRS